MLSADGDAARWLLFGLWLHSGRAKLITCAGVDHDVFPESSGLTEGRVCALTLWANSHGCSHSGVGQHILCELFSYWLCTCVLAIMVCLDIVHMERQHNQGLRNKLFKVELVSSYQWIPPSETFIHQQLQFFSFINVAQLFTSCSWSSPCVSLKKLEFAFLEWKRINDATENPQEWQHDAGQNGPIKCIMKWVCQFGMITAR